MKFSIMVLILIESSRIKIIRGFYFSFAEIQNALHKVV